MAATNERHALRVRTGQPSEQVLPHVLGKEDHANYRAALQKLAEHRLTQEWAWTGQTDGWAVRLKNQEATVCTLLLARTPIEGQVGVGKQQLEAIRTAGLLPSSVLRAVESGQLRGTQRLVHIRLDTGTGLSQLAALVAAKLQSGPAGA